MHTRVRTILATTVALAVIGAMGLTVLVDQPAYAKGPVDSSDGNSSNSSSGSSSSSGSGNSGSSSSSNSNSSGSSKSYSSGGSSSSGSSRSSSDSRSDIRRYEAPSSSSRSRLDQDFYLRTPTSSRTDDRRPAPSYRKEYADIGELWKSRQEKRDPFPSSRTQDLRRSDDRRDGWYYGRDDRHWGGQTHGSSFRYGHYCYDYRPTYCYPSPYCYYYDYYPPYVYYDRVVVVTRLSNRVYVEVPVFVYRSSSDYYLTNPADKSLWATLRDVQLSWEKSDISRLMDHVDRRGTIDVYLGGEYTYSVDRFDYTEMTLDAMLVIKTRTFDFDRVTRDDSNRYTAHGTHVYTDRYGATKSVYISYTFERYGSEWYITAVGSSTRPI